MTEPAFTGTHAVEIPVDHAAIAADVSMPAEPRAVIVFAHGSGSSRFSVRNRAVAIELVRASFTTVLADLLTPPEAEVDEQTARFRFDIPRLAGRVIDVLDWLDGQQRLAELPVGLFGASTGAAAALLAAAERPGKAGAVVSRGGRPDLAGGEPLARVRAPTLLLVGERDPDVLELNREAMARMTCECRLEVIAGATHLFEEPGTLEQVTARAIGWFEQHLPDPRRMEAT